MSVQPESSGAYEVGAPVDQASFVLGAVSVYLNYARESTRYMGHNQNVRDIFDRYGLMSVPMEMQAGMHDLVEGLYSEDPDVRSETQTFIGALYEGVGEESRTAFVIGLGYAVSGVLWEAETAEAWRGPAEAKVDALEGVTDAEKYILQAAISKNISPDTDQEEIGRLLKRHHMLDLNITSLSEAAERRDIEGLLGKSAELIDNLRNRPPGNPASTWRDCIEVLTCFAPVLDLCDYGEIATELRGLVYEFLFEDHTAEAEKARRQYDLSVRHHDQVEELVNAVVDLAAAPDDGVQDNAHPLGIKTLGSMMYKFSDKDYKDTDAELIPDGLRTRIFVTDEAFTLSNMEDFASRIEQQISSDCEAWGIAVEDLVIENYMRDQKPNKYSAFHLAYILNIDGEQVPFEIQIVGASQHRLNTFGPPSHLLYKLAKSGVSTSEDDSRQLLQFEGRARHLKFKADQPMLNPNTWMELAKRLPELPTPIQEVFAVNNVGYLVPKELGDLELHAPHPEIKNNVFLPPSRLTIDQFKYMINLLDPSPTSAAKVNKALSIISERHKDTRRDGITSDIEGHLLPAALHAAILATASGRRWEHEDETSFMAKIIVVALLHDLVEDTFEDKEEGIQYVAEEFDPQTAAIVHALTMQNGDVSPDQLRHQNALQLKNSPEALIIKVSDRMQNHIRDLVRMWTHRATIPNDDLDEIESYFSKTDRHLAAMFDDLPDEMYGETLAVVRELYSNLRLQVRRT